MDTPDLTVQRLARQLNWSAVDARVGIEAIIHRSGGMSPDDAAAVVVLLNQSIVEMDPGMVMVVILAAAYRTKSDDRTSSAEARSKELQAVGGS